MNKRLVKKMKKKKEQFNGTIFAEGNNGGDIIEIEHLEDGRLYLKSGSCCVMMIDKIVPVEFLTGILRKVMLEHNEDINSVIEWLGWGEDFTKELQSKVSKY